MVYFLTFIVAYCSLVYELLMAQTLSALMGNTVLRYSITIGVYLASLGVGSILCKEKEKGQADRLVRIEMYLSIIGGLSVILLCTLDMLHRYFSSAVEFFGKGIGIHILPIMFFAMSHSIIVIIGVLSLRVARKRS